MECGCLHGGVIENGRTHNPLTLWTVPVFVHVYGCGCTYWVDPYECLAEECYNNKKEKKVDPYPNLMTPRGGSLCSPVYKTVGAILSAMQEKNKNTNFNYFSGKYTKRIKEREIHAIKNQMPRSGRQDFFFYNVFIFYTLYYPFREILANLTG